MVHGLLRRLTFANVCSVLALAIALGTGTAYAANTIRSKDIANGQVRAPDLGRSSVTSPKIKDDGVTLADIAADAVDSTTVRPDSLSSGDLAADSVAGSELAADSVSGSELAAGSVKASELAGGESNALINVNAGFVAVARCRDFGVFVAGALPGDAVIFSLNTTVPEGILFQGVRVSAPDVVTAKVCNHTSTTFPQLNNIQVAIVTIRL